MARFSAYNTNSTPVINANNNNLNLMGTTAIRAQVVETTWGGGASSSTPMETAWQRTSTAGTTPPASATIARLDQTITSSLGNLMTALANAAWATGPTKVAGALFGCAWNAYGGVVRWLAAPGYEWDLALTANGIVCPAVVGTGVSTYHSIWQEF
jgi:hypothetical protein